MTAQPSDVLASAPNLVSSENFQHSEHIDLHIQLATPIYHLPTWLLFIISLPGCSYFKVLYNSLVTLLANTIAFDLACKQWLLSGIYI